MLVQTDQVTKSRWVVSRFSLHEYYHGIVLGLTRMSESYLDEIDCWNGPARYCPVAFRDTVHLPPVMATSIVTKLCLYRNLKINHLFRVLSCLPRSAGYCCKVPAALSTFCSNVAQDKALIPAFNLRHLIHLQNTRGRCLG